MPTKKREKNQHKFDNWNDKEDGGRVYWFEISGHHGWKAKYVKEVDKNEKTISFRQEIYNQQNKLVEIHEKYPLNKGHKKIIK